MMTATHDDDAGSDHEHWPDDSTYLQIPSPPAPGHDSQNGLHRNTYHPAPKDPPAAEAPRALPAPHVISAELPAPYLTYPIAQYAYAQPAQIVYPAPAYYTYAQPAQPMTGGQDYTHVYKPADSAPRAPNHQWLGRTKEQVEEDNMKVAAREGAYDKRKVEPVGVKSDQVMWVVETDGSHTLRPFASIKELKGEWKKDPRFEDSYYFVREKEGGKEKGKD